jgi:hypothetical protein
MISIRFFVRHPRRPESLSSVFGGLEQNRGEAALSHQPIRDSRLEVEGVSLSMARQLAQKHDLLLTDCVGDAIDDRLRGALLRARHPAGHAIDARHAMSGPYARR